MNLLICQIFISCFKFFPFITNLISCFIAFQIPVNLRGKKKRETKSEKMVKFVRGRELFKQFLFLFIVVTLLSLIHDLEVRSYRMGEVTKTASFWVKYHIYVTLLIIFLCNKKMFVVPFSHCEAHDQMRAVWILASQANALICLVCFLFLIFSWHWMGYCFSFEFPFFFCYGIWRQRTCMKMT